MPEDIQPVVRSRGVEEVHVQGHVTLEVGANMSANLRLRIDAEGARSVVTDVRYRCRRVKNECDAEGLPPYIDVRTTSTRSLMP